MSQITNGKVLYGRTVKVADYENKKAEAEFSFTVEEGEDHNVIAQVAAQDARRIAHGLLGIKPAGEAAPAAPRALAGAAMDKDDPALPATPAPKPAKEPKPPKAAAPKPSDDLNLDDDGGAEAKPAKTKEEIAAKLNAEEITDADFMAKAQARAQALGETGPSKIKALVKEYNPEPGKGFALRQIAQEDRAGFLKKMAALT